MSVRLRFDLHDLAQAGPRLQQALAGDLADLFEEIGDALVSSTTDRFDTGRGPDEAPWVPSRRAEAEGGKTLVQRGHLRDSVTRQAGADHVLVGSNLAYAAIHQQGGTVKPRRGKMLKFKVGGQWVSKAQVTLPARPYLGISAEDEAEIGDILREHIAARLGR